MPPHHRRRAHRNKRRATINHHGSCILWRSIVQITRVDTAAVADGVDERQCGGSFRRGARHGVADPGEGDDEGGVDGGDHEHHGEVAGAGVHCRGGDDIRDDGDGHGDGYVQVALAGLVGVGGVEVGYGYGEDVGRRGEQEGLNVAVVEGFDDGGEEVGYGAGCDDGEEKEHLGGIVLDQLGRQRNGWEMNSQGHKSCRR